MYFEFILLSSNCPGAKTFLGSFLNIVILLDVIWLFNQPND